mmetsp:Transcript_33978/g.101470  ORF Transcript_33978/g.101470 Transcript_33978/m.101470 type:complete len:281 (+) Transcript_33978:2004-2846(+)
MVVQFLRQRRLPKRPTEPQMKRRPIGFRDQHVRCALNLIVREAVHGVGLYHEPFRRGNVQPPGNSGGGSGSGEHSVLGSTDNFKERSLRLGAESGRHTQRFSDFRRQSQQLGRHELRHVVRDILLQNSDNVPLPSSGRERKAKEALVAERDEELKQEEGVSAGFPKRGLRQSPGGPGHRTKGPRHESIGMFHVEIPQANGCHADDTAAAAGIVSNFIQQVKRQGMPVADFVVPIASDDQESVDLHIRNETQQHSQGHFVRPLKVVEEHDHRTIAAARDAQ